MKKSFLFLLLTAATIFTAQAKSYEIYVGGVQVTDENKDAIQEGVSFALDENQSTCGILYLNNAHIVADRMDQSAIEFMGTTEMRELDIRITGSCSLTARRGDGMFIYTAEDESAYVFIMPETDNARLTVNASNNGFSLQDDAELNFGYLGLHKTLIIDVTCGGIGVKATKGLKENAEAYLTITQDTNLSVKAGTDNNPQTIFDGLYKVDVLGSPAISPESAWSDETKAFADITTGQPVTGYLEIVNVAGTGIEDIVANDSSRSQTKKVMLDGNIYLLMPDGSVCNIQGQRVR